MNRFQLENLYEINGLVDFKLKGTDDIFKTHSIKALEIDGYNGLTDEHKEIYKRFIVNIFNAFGLESRATLIPKGIYYVEDVSYLVKTDPKDDYYTVAGGKVNIIDKDGNKVLLREWKDEDYTHLEIKESEKKNYLRFVYEHDGNSEWLHVTKEGKEWY